MTGRFSILYRLGLLIVFFFLAIILWVWSYFIAYAGDVFGGIIVMLAGFGAFFLFLEIVERR